MGVCVQAQDRVPKARCLHEGKHLRSLLLSVSYLSKIPPSAELSLIPASANYFSFPSFEDFQEYHQDQERREGRQESGVP